MNSRWEVAAKCDASLWLLYDIATKAPRPALAMLRHALLACALVALVCSAVIYATDR